MVASAPPIRPDRTINICVRRGRVFALSLLMFLISACGMLTPLPESIDEYPDDFAKFLNQGDLHGDYNDLVFYLEDNGVHDTVPTWQLLLQGTDWKSHKLPKYAIPPRENWRDMINTLAFLKYDLLPYTGPVKVLSGFRTPGYNLAAGGADKSRHLSFSALDLKPVNDIDRAALHSILKDRWNTLGEQYKLGLGLYNGLRFHIDTGGHRQW